MKRILVAVFLIVAGCSPAASSAPPEQETTPVQGSAQTVNVYHDVANRATCWYIADLGGYGEAAAIYCIADSVLHP